MNFGGTKTGRDEAVQEQRREIVQEVEREQALSSSLKRWQRKRRGVLSSGQREGGKDARRRGHLNQMVEWQRPRWHLGRLTSYLRAGHLVRAVCPAGTGAEWVGR